MWELNVYSRCKTQNWESGNHYRISNDLDILIIGLTNDLRASKIRKDLTDQWKIHNVEEGEDYARLTDIIYHSWAGLTAREYKRFKGLHQENLRDNMTNEELVMNMLAELTTTNITKEEHPLTMDEHSKVAARGGSVARIAKDAYEHRQVKKLFLI